MRPDIDALARMAYDAAIEPDCCEPFLQALATAFDARAGNLNFVDTNYEHANMHVAVGMPPEALAAYEARYWRFDEWRLGAAARGMPVGRVVDGRELVTDERLRASVFFNEHLRELDLFHWCGVRIDQGVRGHFVLSLQRAPRQDNFDAAVRAALESLLPHLDRAVRLMARLAEFGMSDVLNATLLSHTGAGAAVLDGKGRVLHADPAAVRMLEGTVAMTNGGFRPAQPDGALALAIARARKDAEGAGIPTSFEDRARRLRVDVLPVSPGTPCSWGGSPAVVVLVSPAMPRRVPDRPTLISHYGLTQAEAALAASLLDGATLRRAAERQGITPGTARQYLKRVFAKTGTHRQSELIRMLLTDA